MYLTGFGSLWITNTAATSMMLPIALALSKELVKHASGFEKKFDTISGKLYFYNKRKFLLSITFLTFAILENTGIEIISFKK
jgi:hypothetical protein